MSNKEKRTDNNVAAVARALHGGDIMALQLALDATGFTANGDYCRAKNSQDADGILGKNTRKDIIDFLEKYPEFEKNLGNELKNNLKTHGWAPRQTTRTPAPVMGPNAPRAHATTKAAPTTYAASTLSPKEQALKSMGDYIATAEHSGADINDKNYTDKIYDIKNGRVFPKINGVPTKATECTVGQISNVGGSHGKWQLNKITFPGYFDKNHFRSKYVCEKLGVDSVAALKALPFDKHTQDVMGHALLEQEGFSKMLTGAYSPQKYLREIANRWAGLPKDSSGAGVFDGDKHDNKATVKYRASIRAIQSIRDNFVVDSLRQDLGSVGIDIDEYLNCSDPQDILADPNLVNIFRANPDAILALSPQTCAALMNMGMRDDLQDIVKNNPWLKAEIERNSVDLAQGQSLKNIAKDPQLLTALQGNWALLGTYTAAVDGKNGPSTAAAFNTQGRVENIRISKAQFGQNVAEIMEPPRYLNSDHILSNTPTPVMQQ